MIAIKSLADDYKRQFGIYPVYVEENFGNFSIKVAHNYHTPFEDWEGSAFESREAVISRLEYQILKKWREEFGDPYILTDLRSHIGRSSEFGNHTLITSIISYYDPLT